jgi:hypothetical protein
VIYDDRIVQLAKKAHKRLWSGGSDVSAQTKKAQSTCKLWQDTVRTEFPDGFDIECGIASEGARASQRIDLVDCKRKVAYEMKASPNNVHMEVYRDVFKTLVFNERHPKRKIKTLVFIAPATGIGKLGAQFVEDVKAIAARLGLKLILCELP